MSNYWYPKHMYTDLSYGLTDALKLAGFDGSAEGGAFTKCCMDMGITPQLDYKYKCGFTEKNGELKYADDVDVSYNCNTEHNFCKSIKLILDDGTTEDYKESTDTVVKPGIKIISSLNTNDPTDISVNNIFEFSDELMTRTLSNGFSKESYPDICNQLVFSDIEVNPGEDILDDQDVSNSSMTMSAVKNNCLISQGRKFKLFLANGLLQLSFFENDCEYDPENEVFLGKSNNTGSAGVFKLDDKSKYMGKLYNIDGQGVYREFSNFGYSKESNQFKVIPRVSSNGATVLQTLKDSTKTQCENICVNDNNCAGYQFDSSTEECTTFKNDKTMYPFNQTNKNIDKNINTYVRVPYNINSKDGCKSSRVNTFTTDELQNYSFDHSDKMSDIDDCGVSLEIKNRLDIQTSDIRSIEVIESDLNAKRELILSYIQKLTEDEKKTISNMGTNVIKMERDLSEYKDIKQKKIQGRLIDVTDGQLEDSNKKLNKEMSFLVGTSIASIVLLLVAINLQKK